MSFVFGLFLLFSSAAYAHIYAVPSMLEAIFDGRKELPVEAVLRHRVGGRNEGQINIREKLYRDGRRTYFSWTIEGGNQESVHGRISSRAYVIGKQKLARRSALFVEYLLGRTPEKLQRALLSEQFLRQDQLLSFKRGYPPEGNPRNWKPGENYIRHDDIYMKPIGVQTAIWVVGTDAGLDKRIWYIHKRLQGVHRFEWTVEGRVTSWNFEHFKRFRREGHYPRRISLNQGSVEVVSSELVKIRHLSKKEWAKTRKQLSRRYTGSIPSRLVRALNLMLSYR